MKKLGIFLFIIGMILIISGLAYKITASPNKEEPKKTESPFSLENTRKIKICKKNGSCNLTDQEFSTLKSKTPIKEVQEAIKEINNKTKEYYIMAKSTTTESTMCENVRKDYKYQKYILTNYQLFEDDEIISIAVYRSISDLCIDTYETIPYDIIIYDKKQNKTLTQEDVLNKVGYTSEMINERITTSITTNNSLNDYEIPLEDVFTNGQPTYSLFYNEDGNVVMAYQIKKSNTFDYEEVILG